MDAPRLCRRDAFGLPLANALALVLGEERKQIENNVVDEHSHQVFASARVQKRHIDYDDVYMTFFCQNAPLVLNFVVVPAKAVDALYVEQVARLQIFHPFLPVFRVTKSFFPLAVHSVSSVVKKRNKFDVQ